MYTVLTFGFNGLLASKAHNCNYVQIILFMPVEIRPIEILTVEILPVDISQVEIMPVEIQPIEILPPKMRMINQ